MTMIGVGQADFGWRRRGSTWRLSGRCLRRPGGWGWRSGAAGAGQFRLRPERAGGGAGLRRHPAAGGAVRLLAEWSRPGRLAVCGVCERDGERLYNAAVIFGGGQHLGTYRKAHLFMREPELFLPGEAPPPVIDFHGWRGGRAGMLRLGLPGDGRFAGPARGPAPAAPFQPGAALRAAGHAGARHSKTGSSLPPPTALGWSAASPSPGARRSSRRGASCWRRPRRFQRGDRRRGGPGPGRRQMDHALQPCVWG